MASTAAIQPRAAGLQDPKTTQQAESPKEKEPPTWGLTLAKFVARALVRKAKRRKLKGLLAYNRRHEKNSGLFRNQREYRHDQKFPKLKSEAECLQSKRVRFEASLGFNGGAGKRRSFSEEGAFANTVESLHGEYNEVESEDRGGYGGAGLRNLSGQIAKGKNGEAERVVPQRSTDQVFASRGHRGGPSQRQPDYSQRKPHQHPYTKRINWCKYPESEIPESEIPKSKQIRDNHLNQLMMTRPPWEIFVSRRRKVTQSERDEARSAAQTFASTLNATTILVVMRKSFVYRYFELDVSREFAQMYMPLCNKAVRLMNDNWKAWSCGWNSAANCISGRGWRNFALEHCVEKDDALVLEIIAETKAILTIKVHIFRVVPIRNGLTGWKSHLCPPNCKRETNNCVPILPIPSAGPMQPRSGR